MTDLSSEGGQRRSSAAAADMALTPITRGKLAETVANQLLAAVKTSRMAPGERLPSERELMSAFGVGRSTVREAVNGLAMLGALEIRHGQGAFVVNPDAGAAPPQAIAAALARGITQDLFEARRLVEPYVARLAAERRTEADVRELARALSDHERALAAAESAVEPSVRFHVMIGEAAHSDVLAGFVASAAQTMQERGPLLEAEPGYREWELDQHRSVFEPIRDRDPEAAEAQMRAHLEAVIPKHERLGVP
jgi:GntR family transcriptional regulator, transcriptional repressor for pyruvate dehydrogenase complex